GLDGWPDDEMVGDHTGAGVQVGPAGDGRSGHGRAGAATRYPAKAGRRRRGAWWVAAVLGFMVLSCSGLALGGYYFDTVPTPEELQLPEATTVYFADGKTVMAQLGNENRTILSFGQMSDAVKQSIVAAEDQTFWTNPGVDFRGVLRA